MAGQIILSRREALIAGFGCAALAAHPAWAFQAQTDPLDMIVTGFMGEFEIPGVAVALVRPGQVITRGYGVRRLGSPARVDADTQFAIASNSKGFVAATLAMLVDDGRIAWDTPVLDYLPDFQMSDPDATRLMTVRDLLVHRSGLALGAGDLMQFPLSDHSRADIFRGLRHLPLARCAKGRKRPQTNADFWAEKLARNAQRDEAAQTALIDIGWSVVVVWECDLGETLDALTQELNDRREALRA